MLVRPNDINRIEPNEHELTELRGLQEFFSVAGIDLLTLVDSHGNQVQLPESAVRLLKVGVSALANDDSIGIVTAENEVELHDAATRLELPVDYLTEVTSTSGMLIDSSKSGNHIRFTDLLLILRSEDALQALADQGQQLSVELESFDPDDE